MSPADRIRHQQALDWVRRIDDPGFAEWEAHAAWLESDPRNPDAFDAASLLIEDATEDLSSPGLPPAPVHPVNDNVSETAPAGHWRWGAALGLGIAAALALFAVLPSPVPHAGRTYLVRTGPGEQRMIALTDGTTVALNGGSLVQLDRADRRTVTVKRGEAFFTVSHDAVHPFTVHAGSAVFQDVGTAFDVIRTAASTEIAVREGMVMYDPAGVALRLSGGQALSLEGNEVVMRHVGPGDIGGWRQGRLSYHDAPLPAVAADIARSIGKPVTVDPALAGRRFSGVIIVDRDRALMFRRIAAVADVTIHREGAGWRMALPGR